MQGKEGEIITIILYTIIIVVITSIAVAIRANMFKKQDSGGVKC